MSPRVLFVTGEYPPMMGGIADYTSLLVHELSNHDVQPLVLSGSETNADEIVDPWSWHTIRQIRSILDRRNIDVVHIQYQAGAFRMHPVVNVLPAALHPVPVITTFHDMRPPYLFPKAGRLRFLAMKRMARSSHSSIVTNPRDQGILEFSGLRPIRIPLGPSLPPPHPSVQPGHDVGYFGFPSRQKGFDQIIEALGKLPAADRPGLLVVGNTPTATGNHGFLNAAEIEFLGQTHGVRLHWTGFMQPQEASDALAGCSVIAFPFPRGATQRSSALIASLQTGRPVITTTPEQPSDLDGLAHLPQLVQIPRGDVAALARALKHAHTTTVQWSALPAKYAWTSIGAHHAALYHSILGEVPA